MHTKQIVLSKVLDVDVRAEHDDESSWGSMFQMEYGYIWNSPVAGAIKRPLHELPRETFSYDGFDRFYWYVPYESVEGLREEYIEQGYSRHEADNMARERLNAARERLLDYYRGDWYFIRIEVTVSWNGLELGSDLLSGIESDGGEEYIEEAVADVKSVALSEAQKTLEALCNALGGTFSWEDFAVREETRNFSFYTLRDGSTNVEID